MRLIFASMTLLALVSSGSGLAQTALSNDFSNNDLSNKSQANNTSSLTPQDDFLRVEEAYQVSIEASPAELILNWQIEPEYYLYRDQFKVLGYGPDGKIELDPQYQPGKVKYDEYFDKDMEVYYDQTQITSELPDGLEKIELQITSQGCADAGLCYPPHTERFAVDLTNGDAEPIETLSFGKPGAAPNNPGGGGGGLANADSGASSVLFLPYIMLLAVLGGIILNAMPCVFPVLSIKALSFVSNHGSKHSNHSHGWAYTAGTIVSFLVIGGIIVAIRASGSDADWGRQLQSPLFVTAMAYLFLVMGLSLSGFVHFGTRLMGVGQSLTAREGLQGSFYTGVLAVVVASPCTAPFMAPALGVALTQSAPVALAIFAALGLGMALPFLLLSYSPKLANWLPQPGAWMEVFKQALAFPLYLTAVWLLWVFGRQTSMDAAAAVLIGGIAIVFAIWLWQKHPASSNGRIFTKGAALVSLVLALTLALRAENLVEDDIWQAYSPARVAELRAQGKPVFINLTAAWCITCHANERVALSRQGVLEAAKQLDIAMIKGDYTNEDPQISALLNRYQRPSVPLYLMFPADPDAPPEILPQLLTQRIVIEAMERASGEVLAATQ